MESNLMGWSYHKFLTGQFMLGSHSQGNWDLDKWMNLSKMTHLRGSRFKTKEQSIFLFITLHVSKMKKIKILILRLSILAINYTCSHLLKRSKADGICFVYFESKEFIDGGIILHFNIKYEYYYMQNSFLFTRFYLHHPTLLAEETISHFTSRSIFSYSGDDELQSLVAHLHIGTNLKSICPAKTIINKMKRQLMM